MWTAVVPKVQQADREDALIDAKPYSLQEGDAIRPVERGRAKEFDLSMRCSRSTNLEPRRVGA
jgi:hypothetical protein